MLGKNKCPDEVRVALLQILETAILSIRFNANSGKSNYCFIEADHIHNIPGILVDFNIEKLEWYFNATKESYIESMQGLEGSEPLAYKNQWDVISKHVKS